MFCYSSVMNYLKRAVELSKASFDAGMFPAGAVLVTASGTTYDSGPSVAHNHGESSVVDQAVESEGLPLKGATIYASMHPCIMCSAKMYWAGVRNVEFVIPKSAVNTEYAYENNEDVDALVATFHEPVIMIEKPELFDEAISHYNDWVRKIESA